MQKQEKEKMKLTAAMGIFGTIGIVRKYIPYPSAAVALARGAIGALVLLLVRIYKKEKLPMAAIRKNGIYLGFSGALLGINWIFLFEAYRYTSVSVATVCYYMAPVFILLLSPFFLKERLTRKKWICALLAVGGMVLASGVFESGFYGLKGVLLGLGAAAMYTAVVILNKKIQGLSANDRTAIQLSASALTLLPYVLLTVKPEEVPFQRRAVLLLLVAGVLHTGIAYLLYFGSVAKLPAQTAAVLGYIDPIVAVLLSVTVLHEEMSALSLLGTVLALGATIVSETERKKQKT